MCRIAIRGKPAVSADEQKHWQPGDFVTVRDDGFDWGGMDPARAQAQPVGHYNHWSGSGPRPWYFIDIPGVPRDHPRIVSLVQPQVGALGRERRRQWRLRREDMPAGVVQKFQEEGVVVIQVGSYAGPFDYTWEQVRGYFRDKQSGEDARGGF